MRYQPTASFITIVLLFAICLGLGHENKELRSKPPTIIYTPSESHTVYKTVSRSLPEQEKPVMAKELGEFKITYYDACVKCCGNTKGITCSGAHVEDGVTVAVDPKVIPLGTYLYIEGIGFRVAQDTGNAVTGNIIDVYVPTHKEAWDKGTYQAKVYIIQEGSEGREQGREKEKSTIAIGNTADNKTSYSD